MDSNHDQASQGNIRGDLLNFSQVDTFEGQKQEAVACPLSNLDKTIALNLKKGYNATALISKKSGGNNNVDSKKYLATNAKNLQQTLALGEKGQNKLRFL